MTAPPCFTPGEVAVIPRIHIGEGLGLNVDLLKTQLSQTHIRQLADQQTEFAVKHQIMTDQTDYLIAMERAEHEQRVKQKKTEIQAMLDYLNTLTEHPEQLDYQRLAQLHAPEELVIWVRLAVPTDALPALIQQVNALTKNAKGWSNFYGEIIAKI